MKGKLKTNPQLQLARLALSKTQGGQLKWKVFPT